MSSNSTPYQLPITQCIPIVVNCLITFDSLLSSLVQVIDYNSDALGDGWWVWSTI